MKHEYLRKELWIPRPINISSSTIPTLIFAINCSFILMDNQTYTDQTLEAGTVRIVASLPTGSLVLCETCADKGYKAFAPNGAMT
jgi:hypothetical protein